MRVVVLGAGLAGVTSAWYLRAAGFAVTVVEQQPGPGLETSFANGGQISVSHPEPWANPGAPLTVLRWLGREDAPLLIRPRADAALWRWAMAFARECLPSRAERNTRAIAALALHSRDCLRALRASCGLDYDQLERGILHLLREDRAWREGERRVATLARLGIRAELLDYAGCTTVEPSLAADPTPLAGGIFARDDESGDAHRFCAGLADHAARAGVDFRFGVQAERLQIENGRIRAVRIRDQTGRPEHLTADAAVLCLGSRSSALLPPGSARLPIYPVKGYSVTVPLIDPGRAPQVSLTEESRRIVCSRLGDRLRIAGTAELNGFDLTPNPVRSGALLSWLEHHFPGVGNTAAAEHWCGLRPATPSNVPLIGETGWPGLWLNTGHGTLGWTLACGSAESLARLMSGRRPEPDFPFLSGQSSADSSNSR